MSPAKIPAVETPRNTHTRKPITSCQPSPLLTSPRVAQKRKRSGDEALCKQLELLEVHWSEIQQKLFKEADLVKLFLICCKPFVYFIS